MKRTVVLLFCSLLALGGVVAGGTVAAAPAGAASCPDVEVVFARGTVETAPPLGVTGLAFVESLRRELPGKSVAVHAVNYPAAATFDNKLSIANSVRLGVRDAQSRIRQIATACPSTRVVVAGYSQGAAVAGYTVTERIVVPVAYERYARLVPPPLPDRIADNVAAVVLFAPPSDRWLRDVGAPPLEVGPRYGAKTVVYCIPGDVVCDGAPVGQPNGLHLLYSVNGDTFRAADYVKSRL